MCQFYLLTHQGWWSDKGASGEQLTSGVMAGSQQDATSRLPSPNNVTSSGRAENAILADDELLHAVRCSDLGDQLCNFGIPVASISTDDEG